jgi:hypothetical protein
MRERDPKLDDATDDADQYLHTWGKAYELSSYALGQCDLPVLRELWGTPWNNFALGLCHSLRPSMLRVTTGETKSDARLYRVTVYLEQDGRTISRIEQEVDVGLYGCRYGADVQSKLQEYDLRKNPQ